MQGKNAYRAGQRNRRGFLLLMVLICLAIILVLYSIMWSGLFRDSRPPFVRPPRRADPNALPWEEDFLLTSGALQGYGLQAETKIRPEQPKITKTMEYKTQVHQDGQPRGELEFRIRPDGGIRGSWSADYKTSAPDMQYSGFLGESMNFEGNAAPSKIFQDEQGQDPSKLYIITRGILMLDEHNLKNNKQRTIRGHLYVTGWLDREYNASGKLTITSGGFAGEAPEWFQTFDWQASGPD